MTGVQTCALPISYALWNVKEKQIDLNAVKKADAIIHLAGAGVMDKKWTEEYKKEIRDSRINSSELLINTLKNFNIRIQLTLFISNQNELIEKIRAEFNPIQFNLIPAHVTLCRENEIKSIEKVIENIKSLSIDNPLRIEFDKVERFDNSKGLLIPAKKGNDEFIELRKSILKWRMFRLSDAIPSEISHFKKTSQRKLGVKRMTCWM